MDGKDSRGYVLIADIGTIMFTKTDNFMIFMVCFSILLVIVFVIFPVFLLFFYPIKFL